MLKPDFRALSHRDRSFGACFLAMYLFGFISNYTRTSPTVPTSISYPIQFISMAAIVAWAAFFGLSVLRRRHTVADLGFSLNGGWATAITMCTAAFAVLAFLRLPSLRDPAMLAIVVLAVTVEEILFRPLLISLLSRCFRHAANPSAVAVAVGALLWAFVHVASKPLSQVFGIFVGGLLFGGLYVLSGSNIFALVVHSAANGGGSAGVIVFTLSVVVAVLPRAFTSQKREAVETPAR